MEDLYDYIIVGGGIAGLYANYLLSDKYNGLLLEKHSHFGGRAYEMDFHGSLIKLGAGIMADHNHELIKLLNQTKFMNIKINRFRSTVETYDVKTHKPSDFNMTAAISKIIAAYKCKSKNHNLTMKQFLVKNFGQKFTNDFILNCEYHDFTKSDVNYFIKYYDIYDMSHDSYDVLLIKWIDLINKLVKKNCLNNINVLNIYKENNIFHIRTENNIYLCKKIYIATTLKPLLKISKNIINIDYKKYIGTVPFVRIYCYFKNGYKSDIPHYTIVNNKLQKVIKINDKILMASYSDSSNALYWKKIKTLSKANQIKIVSKYLSQLNINNKIDDIVIAFWDEGVHYYKPTNNLEKTIKKLSNPEKNVYVIGEMISYKQGWVEGAIQSVNKIIL